MKGFLQKTKLISPAILLVLIFAISLLPKIGLAAQADVVANTGQTVINMLGGFAVSPVLGPLIIFEYLIAQILSLIVTVLGGLVGAFIDMNLSLSMNGNPVINTGWTIARDFANLGLIMGIIFIAIATILRIQEYGIQKILWRLIVVALLINFSLVIAQEILTFSNTISLFFKDAIGGGIDTALANTLDIQKLWATGNSVDVAKLVSLPGLSMMASSLFFIIIFTFLILIAFLALVVMLLARYVALSILLVLLPLACFAWIFPGLSGNWSRWVKEFTKWVIFLPVVLFFIYIAVKSASEIKLGFSAIPGIDLSNAITIPDLFQTAMGMVTLIGLLMGGMMAANELSIVGGAQAHKAGMDFLKNSGKYMRRSYGATLRNIGPKEPPKGLVGRAYYGLTTGVAKTITPTKEEAKKRRESMDEILKHPAIAPVIKHAAPLIGDEGFFASAYGDGLKAAGLIKKTKSESKAEKAKEETDKKKAREERMAEAKEKAQIQAEALAEAMKKSTRESVYTKGLGGK